MEIDAKPVETNAKILRSERKDEGERRGKRSNEVSW